MNPGATTQPEASNSLLACRFGPISCDDPLGDGDVGDTTRIAAAVEHHPTPDREFSCHFDLRSRHALRVRPHTVSSTCRRQAGNEAGEPGARGTPGIPSALMATTGDAVDAFTISVDDAVLSDLRHRLERTRLPDQIEGTGWEYGIPIDYLRSLVEYWRDTYDWRRQEERLNSLPHFRTRIDGQSIHFVHARSPHEDALPLLLTHGWPGSFHEFFEVIPRLTDPETWGGRADDAFHVIAPSPPRLWLLGSSPHPGLGRGADGRMPLPP